MQQRIRPRDGALQVQFAADVDSRLLRDLVSTDSAESARRVLRLHSFRGETFEFLRKIKHGRIRCPFRGSFEHDELRPRLHHVIEFTVEQDVDLCSVVALARRTPGVECASYVPSLNPPAGDDLVGTRDFPDPIGNVSTQWYLYRCQALQAWKLLQSSSAENIVVADIDWGFLVGHPEFKQRIGLKYNATDGSQNVSIGDDLKHGTGALGLIGAARDGQGMVGFAPEATLWAIQASEDGGEVDPTAQVSYWADAVDYVTTLRAHQPTVINIEAESASHRRIDQICSVRVVIQRAISVGIVVCIPAGNGDIDARFDDCGTVFPSSGAIVVGASSFDDCRYTGQAASNYGPAVDVCAPGHVGIDTTCSARAEERYTSNYGGTSGASAKVAGAAALVLQANRSLDHKRVANILKSTGMPITLDRPVGALINCSEAVKRAQAMPRS